MPNFLPIVGLGIFGLYLAAFAVYLRLFMEKNSRTRRVAQALLISVVLVHFLAMLWRTATFGHFPVSSLFEFFSTLALAIAVVYLVIELLIRNRHTAIFVLPLVCVCQFISSLSASADSAVNPIYRDPAFSVHIFTAILAYSAFGIAFIYSMIFLVLYRQIKAHRFGILYNRLPDLTTLENMGVAAVGVGAVTLFLSAVIGLILVPRIEDSSWFDPKIIATWLVLIIYIVQLVLHRAANLRGRRFAMLTIGNFVLLFVIFMLASHGIIKTFHQFH